MYIQKESGACQPRGGHGDDVPRQVRSTLANTGPQGYSRATLQAELLVVLSATRPSISRPKIAGKDALGVNSSCSSQVDHDRIYQPPLWHVGKHPLGVYEQLAAGR
jgi:hypothetical protein